VVLYELHPAAGRATVIVNVKRAHENAYQELCSLQILTHDIVNAQLPLSFYGDNRVTRADPEGIDHSSVGRAYQVFTRRNISFRISEKPDMSPE
jgi:hypothetical protein